MATKRPANPLKTKRDVLNIQDYLKYKSKRNYTIFVLGITTGYRAGDLVKLQVRDIKEAIKYKEFEIEEGKKFNNKRVSEKNRKARKAELFPATENILKEYIKDMKDYEYVFKSRKGENKPIGVQAISNALKEAGEYFGLYNISAHSMRKTYAYQAWLDSDKDTLSIKELLGHSSTEETKLYLGLDKEQYRSYTAKMDSWVRR